MLALTVWSRVEAIYDRILERANPLRPIDPIKSPQMERAIRAKIERAVTLGDELTLVLPAFPAKSPNREKTLGSLPDFGEALALTRLDELCGSLEQLHEPGVRLVICSDGRVFNDLVRVPDAEVDAYSRGIKTLIARRRLSHLSTFNLDDVFGGFEFARMREELVSAYGTPLEEIRRRTREGEEHRSLFNGIHRFVFEDRLVLEPEKSRNRVREEAKTVAYEVIQRSNAWSAVVEGRYPDAIRLSIHPQGPHTEKLGVKLLPSKNHWRTPWHGVVVGNGEWFQLTTRRSAVEAGGELRHSEEGLGYFHLHRVEALA